MLLSSSLNCELWMNDTRNTLSLKISCFGDVVPIRTFKWNTRRHIHTCWMMLIAEVQWNIWYIWGDVTQKSARLFILSVVKCKLTYRQAKFYSILIISPRKSLLTDRSIKKQSKTSNWKYLNHLFAISTPSYCCLLWDTNGTADD